MANRSKLFFIIFFSFIFIIIAVSFCKYFIFKDYYIKAEIPCNPEQENCFMVESDSGEGISYYKIIEKKARDIPLCDTSLPNCLPFVCKEKQQCKEILCNESNKPEGIQCSSSKKLE